MWIRPWCNSLTLFYSRLDLIDPRSGHHYYQLPVVCDHLLAVPPGSPPHFHALGLPKVLEQDVRVEAVWGGASGEIARPHH